MSCSKVPPSRRVLITGASGFVAGPLAEHLQDHGYDVRLHGRLDGDIVDPEMWTQALREIDTVYHLAAQTSARRAESDPVADWQTNAGSVLRLVSAARMLGQRPVVVLAGSDTQAGQLAGVVTDKSCDRPVTIYDQHKLCAEQYLEWGTRQGFIRGVTLRFSTLYGAGPRVSAPDRGVVNSMIRRALRGEPLMVYGDGSYLRDFLHVDDAAAAMRLGAAHIDSLIGEHFVVGFGSSLTLAEAFTRIADVAGDVAGIRSEVRQAPWPADALEIDKRSLRLDSSRFCERTGWKPQRTFDWGVADAARNFAREDV